MMDATCFTCFPNLPKELQDQIWNFSLKPRFVVLQPHIFKYNCQRWYDTRFTTNTKVPAILHTTQNSRKLGLRSYSQLLIDVVHGGAETVPSMYINTALDTIYLLTPPEIKSIPCGHSDHNPYEANENDEANEAYDVYYRVEKAAINLCTQSLFRNSSFGLYIDRKHLHSHPTSGTYPRHWLHNILAIDNTREFGFVIDGDKDMPGAEDRVFEVVDFTDFREMLQKELEEDLKEEVRIYNRTELPLLTTGQLKE